MSTLTSTNSIFTLAVLGLYNVPQTLEGYAADDAFSTDDIDTAETVMGVDGRLSAGYVPVPKNIHIVLQADSPSMDIFDNWQQAQDAVAELFECAATIRLPGLGVTYGFTRGFLVSTSPFSSAKKIQQSRKFTLRFQEFAWARIR